MDNEQLNNFPHSLIIFLFEDYSSPNRMTLLNDFILKSNIGVNTYVIAAKTKDILTLLEEVDGYIKWYVSKSEFTLSKESYKELEPYKRNFGTPEETLANNRISAHLTIKGIDYALNIIRERRRFNSMITTNNFTKINVLLTIVFSFIITVIQINSCRREKQIDSQEQHRLSLDSLYRAQQEQESSRLYNLLLPKVAMSDSLKTSKK